MALNIQKEVKKIGDSISKVKDALAAEKEDKVQKGELSSDEKELVDELHTVTKAIAEVAPQIKRQEELKKVLASIAADKERFESEKPAILRGNKAFAEFSAVSSQRKVKDLNGIIGFLKNKVGGYEGLLKFIKIGLSDVDEYMTPAEQIPYVEKLLGSRSLKSVHPMKG
jgi:hypothetical protein